MPSAAPYPCTTCRQVGCTTHMRQPWQSSRPQVKRITGRKLQSLRQALWVKANARCAYCQRVILLTEMIRDHTIPLAEGGQDIETNTQPLCQSCSDAKTQREALRGRGGGR